MARQYKRKKGFPAQVRGGLARTIMLTVFAGAVLLASGVCSAAYRQILTDMTEGENMIRDYFRGESVKLQENCLSEIKTLDDWLAKKEIYRKQLFEMLGMDPMPERGDLQAVVTGKIDHEDFVVEKVHFQASPGLYVTGNLYIPKGLTGPAPTVLYVCGHSAIYANGYRGALYDSDIRCYGNKTAFQHHPTWFARHGYVCLIIDTLQSGEVQGIHHGMYRYNMFWWNSRGYTSAGVEAWFSIRALDYLETRPEVDMEKVGVTGISGGGADSWWIAALDERIKAAVPVAGITDVQNHVYDDAISGHCDCMYFVNTYRWDYPMVAALVAPRALLIANSDRDRIFPLDGVMRVHAGAKKIYKLYGAEEKLGVHITAGGHKDSQEQQMHAFTWMNQWLKDDRSLINMPAATLFEPKDLSVFDELPNDGINSKIHDVFTARAGEPVVPQTAEQWSKRRDYLKKTLLEKTFGGWPKNYEAMPLDIEPVFSVERDGVRLSAVDFTSQHDIRLRLYLVEKADLTKIGRIVLSVLDEDGWGEWLAGMRTAFEAKFFDEKTAPTDKKAFDSLKRKLNEKGVAMAYISPRGIGLTAWSSDESKSLHIHRSFMLLGQTQDGMRVFDIRRAIQTLRQIEQTNKAKIQLEGHGVMAGVALYASLFEPGIERLDLYDLPKRHEDGPELLNVLRFMDVPEAVAMAAQRSSVRIYNKDKSGWEFPKAVAKSLGWGEDRIEVDTRIE